MYRSNLFYADTVNGDKIFSPAVTSVFKILADNSYYHVCDDEEYMSHAQKTIAFIRCTDGTGQIYAAGRTYILHENEYIFLRFHDIEKYKSAANIWGYNWVNFISASCNADFETDRIYSTPLCEKEDRAFNDLLLNGRKAPENSGYISSLFLSYFYSVILDDTMDEDKPFKSANRHLADEICGYIHQKLYSKTSVGEIADFYKISTRRLHQIFIAELNISPKKYILKKKMEEGYRLLVQSSVPINKIADMLCFSSAYHFTNVFKKTFGQTPVSVRQTDCSVRNNCKHQ